MTQPIGSRLPTFDEAVKIIAQQSTLREQMRQLAFMRDTQGEDFARQVKDKVRAAGEVRKK